MFKFSELTQIHLEITNNCQASCPMCNRNISGGLENPLIKLSDWTLSDFKQIISEEVLAQVSRYYFCSNFGDPTLNNDLINMCRYSAETAPNVPISIHTNGSARNVSWWEELATALPKNHTVVFALDGLEDTHHLYRVGTNFNTIIRNATAFMKAGGIADWAFIKFKHNEHQVEQARQMSLDLGFSNFVLKNSSRFISEPKVTVVDKLGIPTHYIEPSTDTPLKFIDKKIIDSYRNMVSTAVINCKVKARKEVYIDAHKNLYPCSWIANIPYMNIDNDDAFEVRTEMWKEHFELMEVLGNTHVLSKSIKDIVDSETYQSIWHNYWNSEKLIICARTCGDGNFAKPEDQLVNV